jgi:hypothetical protein
VLVQVELLMRLADNFEEQDSIVLLGVDRIRRSGSLRPAQTTPGGTDHTPNEVCYFGIFCVQAESVSLARPG